MIEDWKEAETFGELSYVFSEDMCKCYIIALELSVAATLMTGGMAIFFCIPIMLFLTCVVIPFAIISACCSEKYNKIIGERWKKEVEMFNKRIEKSMENKNVK